MGRKPLPDEVKAMRGTLRKCRTSKTETETPARGVCKPVTKATAPSWLADDAREIFDRTARMLISWKVLTKLDIPLLAAYAAAYANLKRAYADIASGPGYFIETKTQNGVSVSMHPSARLFKDSLDVVNKVGAQFGFSPVSRRQVESADAGERKDAAKVTDPFDQFVGQS